MLSSQELLLGHQSILSPLMKFSYFNSIGMTSILCRYVAKSVVLLVLQSLF